MFTGVIECTLHIAAIADGPMFRRLTLAAPWADVKLGESIAVNGVCLTVAEINPLTGRPAGVASKLIGFDVIKETLDKTNLVAVKQGDEANVERALRLGERLNGHFVQGHVDGTAPLIKQTVTGNEHRLTLSAPNHLLPYITPKGAVALDGVSLTVASLSGNCFDVALIPTTLQLTALGRRPLGWPFNLETDMINKAVVSYLQRFGPPQVK